MTLQTLIENLPANIVYLPPEAHKIEFTEVIAGDLMSDILVSQKDQYLLVTGLATEQAIRTADVSGAAAVLLANDKLPSLKMKELAEDCGIPLLATALPLYEACAAICKLMMFA
ncbi:hypothetical protein H0R92_05860 [Treponema sp. OMZ 840]|uniref:hypothetical protein n=1 Tax=Treponema sp. OMZ 840 TaxID=244313 RepID=UPI003D8E2985